jgi:hypothetical protein
VYVILYKITFLLTFFINEEKIMDKKILLSGAAALIMGFGLYAAPASASITFSHSGEANFSILMDDHCNENDGDIQDGVAGSDGASQGATDAVSGCSEENPVWATDSALDWSAGGTLANGLGVSISDSAAITFSGAFGSISFEEGGDSAVKAAQTGGDGNPDVTGGGLGGHAAGTSGTAGMVALYQAPSMGGMDLYVSYAPNSTSGADSDNNNDGTPFTDTIGIGLTFGMDNLTIGAGFESATNNGDGDCSVTNIDTTTDAQAGALLDQAYEYGGELCGDETVMAIGASMAAGDLTINAGYSELDTEEADQTVMSIGLGMSVGEYSVSLDYVDASRAFLDTGLSHDQTVIAVGAGTNLGDGVDLGLSFSNNTQNIAGTGAHTNYRAEAKVTITY